jgi:hypothetical protein
MTEYSKTYRPACFGDALMNSQELRAALRAVPFRPFTVHMTDGRSFEVRHHDFLLLGPNGRTAFVFSPSGVEFSILDVMLITEIAFGQPETPSATSPASD